MPSLTDDLKRQADKEFVREWTETRAGGRLRYVLLQGALKWGGLMTLSMSLGWWLAYGWSGDIVLLIAFLLVCFTAGGFVVGAAFWRKNEQRWRELTVAD